MKNLFTSFISYAISLLILFLVSGSLRAQSFAKGADVGWLQQMEATGYVFYNDNGVAQDCFQILKDKGINSVRFRVFVNPSNDRASGHCSKDEVVAMSVRAKAMGFRIMIDFHYSDTWADPGNQVKPAAWANHTFDQLKTDVYDHTYDVMNALKTNGVTPEWVQVGNEIRGGMLRPDGSTSNYPQLAQLITSGYNAVKATSPTSKVIVHLDRGNDNALYRGFFDNLRNNGALYDVIGMSYYPYWLNQDYTASIGNLASNLNDMVTRYGKEVIIAEVGGDYTAVQNTYDMLVAVQNVVRAVPNSKGLGVFYWEPEGAKSWSGYQLSAWGDDGKPTRALDAFLSDGTTTPPATSTSVITNPGFEANQFRTQTPTGWSTWSKTAAMATAQYTETGGHSGNYRLTQYSATAYEVSIYQIRTGLPNGSYTLKAWVKSGGGQAVCQLYAKSFGGAEKNYSLPNTGDIWTQIQIPDIQITNGQCEIGLYTLGNAGNYCSLDDVGLYANQTITFPVISPKTVGDADFTPGATASSGLSVSYASANTSVATIVSGKIHIVGAGTSLITASQSGNDTYNTAPVVTQTLTVGTSATSPLPVTNPGFEANQTRTQTPGGWSTYSKTAAMAAAQYTETGGHSGNYRLTHYSASAYEVSIYQIKTGLPNGTYTLKAWVKNFGGQTICQLYAKGFGGAEKTYPLPNVGDTWTQIQITDIQVTNGQCEIGLYTVGNGGNFCSLDDVEFYANQTISFPALTTKMLADADFAPGATVNSGLPITYTSSNSSVATIVDGKIHIIGSGTSIIVASQGGTSVYTAATQVSQTLTVGKQDQAISFPALPEKKVDDADFDAGAATSSALLVSYSSSNTDVATIVNGKIHITGAGTADITASQEGNDTYSAATAVTKTLTVVKQNQSISFNALPVKQTGDVDFDPAATASSGLVVHYTTSNPAVATIVEAKIHIVGAGTTTITAMQIGSGIYNSAADVSQTLLVNAQTQTITFTELPGKKVGDTDFMAGATASSGLGISYSSSNTAVATIVDGKIHIVGAGTCVITASQAGNNTYSAAPAVTQQLVVTLSASVKVKFQDGDNGQVANNNIKPNLTLVNEGTTPVPYSELTVRYWFTAENYTGINTWIDYAQLGNSKVKMKYIWTSQPRSGATGYIEYSFDASAGNLTAGANSGPIQSRFANTDWSNLAETDDYSYQAFTSYTYTDRITVYRTNSSGEPQLIWGNEPAVVAPLSKLKVYSQNTNSNSSSNTISTYLKVDNEGNQPIMYGDLSIRYWFTSEGAQNLNYWIDYAKLGNSNVTGQFTRNVGRTTADSYFELKVKSGAGTLYPASSTGTIQYRIAKSDWSNFSETNDYSYKLAVPFAENDHITMYYKGELVYGIEPASGARLAANEPEKSLQVRILGNPVQGDQAAIEIRGAESQPIQLQLITVAGTPVLDQRIDRASAIEHYFLPLGRATGVYLLRVSIPTESVVLKVIKQ